MPTPPPQPRKRTVTGWMALAGVTISILCCVASVFPRGVRSRSGFVVAIGLLGGLPLVGLFIDWVRTHEPEPRLAIYVGVAAAAVPCMIFAPAPIAMVWYAALAATGMFLWWNAGEHVVEGHIARIHPGSLLIETPQGMLEVDRSLHEWLTPPSPLSLTLGASIALDADTRSDVAGEGPFRSSEHRCATAVRDVEVDRSALERSRAARAGTALKVALAGALIHCVTSWVIQQATCPY